MAFTVKFQVFGMAHTDLRHHVTTVKENTLEKVQSKKRRILFRKISCEKHFDEPQEKRKKQNTVHK